MDVDTLLDDNRPTLEELRHVYDDTINQFLKVFEQQSDKVILLLGDSGVGKTLLCNTILESNPETKVDNIDYTAFSSQKAFLDHVQTKSLSHDIMLLLKVKKAHVLFFDDFDIVLGQYKTLLKPLLEIISKCQKNTKFLFVVNTKSEKKVMELKKAAAFSTKMENPPKEYVVNYMKNIIDNNAAIINRSFPESVIAGVVIKNENNVYKSISTLISMYECDVSLNVRQLLINNNVLVDNIDYFVCNDISSVSCTLYDTFRKLYSKCCPRYLESLQALMNKCAELSMLEVPSSDWDSIERSHLLKLMTMLHFIKTKTNCAKPTIPALIVNSQIPIKTAYAFNYKKKLNMSAFLHHDSKIHD